MEQSSTTSPPSSSSSSGGTAGQGGALKLEPRSSERPADAGWTLVAGLDDPDAARVDGGGLLAPGGADWTIDWWVGADDRWYLPAREPSVRQRRLGAGPIIETALRVPSGDVVATAYPVLAAGATGSDAGWDPGLVLYRRCRDLLFALRHANLIPSDSEREVAAARRLERAAAGP